VEEVLEHAGAAEAERSGLARCGGPQLGPPTGDRDWGGEEPVAVGSGVENTTTER